MNGSIAEPRTLNDVILTDTMKTTWKPPGIQNEPSFQFLLHEVNQEKIRQFIFTTNGNLELLGQSPFWIMVSNYSDFTT